MPGVEQILEVNNMSQDDNDPNESQDKERNQEGGPFADTEIFDEDYISQIADFLSKSGAALLLDRLEESPARFVKLEEDLPVSEPTISDRLEDGHDLNLIDDTRNDKGQLVHELTSMGAALVDQFQRSDLARIRREIRRLEDEYEKEVSKFHDHLVENKDDLDSSAVNNITNY